jgi:DNA-binding NtrC family response regulator
MLERVGRMNPFEAGVVSEVARRKILIVDDEQIILDLLERVLRREGYEVSGVRCPDEAMKRICSESYDLAIAEVNLCRSNGRELTSLVGEASPSTAVIIMTGYPEAAVVRYAEENAQGLLEKPFALERLLATVREALESRVGHAA